MNQAQVNFRYTSEDPQSSLVLYGNSNDCHDCILLPQRPIDCPSENASCSTLYPNETYQFIVDGVYPMNLELRSHDKSVWHGQYEFVEQSEYSIQAQELETGEVHASIVLDKEGTPLVALTVMLVLLLLWTGSCFGLFFWKRHLHSLRDEDVEDDSLTPLIPPETAPKKTRVVSLDVFRGITIFIMIFVNYGGGGYWIFNHSTWNGLTIADLVFPWFAWIMGVSIAIGFTKKFSGPKWSIFKTTSIRSMKLFALGLFINNGYQLETWRIPGVLQSFGVSYFIVTSILLISPSNWFLHVVVMSSFTVFQTVLVFFLPLHGCPTGYIGPGGISDDGKYENCTGGAHRFIDLALFGENHIFQYPTTKYVYYTPSYDPEGFLNWLMVALTTFLGYSVGRIMFSQITWRKKASTLAGFGAAFIVAGLIACQARVNDGWIPINKNLWSLSFVLVTSGLGSLFFSVLYMMVDVFDIWSGKPFLFAGMNAILLYCGHELLESFFPFGFKHDQTSHTATTLSNMLGACSWLFIAYILYKKKIFISV